MTIGPVLLSDFDQKEVSLSANFAPLARNPKVSRSKINWTISCTGPGLGLGLFSRTGFWQCPLSNSPEFGPGHLGRRREPDWHNRGSGIGKKRRLWTATRTLCVSLPHGQGLNTNAWTHCNDQNTNQQLSFFLLSLFWLGLFYFCLVLHDENAVLNKKILADHS